MAFLYCDLDRSIFCYHQAALLRHREAVGRVYPWLRCRVPALIAITAGSADWCLMPDAHEWIEQGGQAAQDGSYRSRLLPLVLGHDGCRPNRKTTEDNRILSEMMEMAQALQGQALISKQDMARMNLICQNPPEYTSENVTLIRVEKAKVSQSVFASMLNVSVSAVQKWESPSSGKHPSGVAAKLLQLIDKKGLEAIVA